MAKKPNDQPDPPEPADLFDWAEAEVTEPPPAEPLGEAELFDFTDDPVTEPMDAIRAAAAEVLPEPAPTPTAQAEDAEDIFGWDTPDNGAASFVGKRSDATATAESSILTDPPELSAANSGWLDSGVKISAPPSSVVPPPPPHGPNSSGINLHDPNSPIQYDSESSIFGQNATELSSRVEFDLDPAAKSGDMTDAIDTANPASIWDETDAVDAEQMAAEREPDDAVDWEMPADLPERQSTLRTPRPEEADEFDAVEPVAVADAEAVDDGWLHADAVPTAAPDADLDGWLATESRTAKKPAPTPPSVLDTAAGLPLSPMPAPKKTPAAHAADSEYDLEPGDEPVAATEPDELTSWLGEQKRPGEKRGPGGGAKPEPRRPTKKSGLTSWLGGGVAGLLIGGAGVFGLSQAGILPGGDSPKPPVANVQPNPNPQPNPQPPGPGPVAPQPLTVAQAAAALDKGDAVAAKAALDAVKPDELTTATQAARGHARLMVRVQELAEAGTDVKGDKGIADAEADLKAVLDKAADAKSPDEQAAIVRAALNLGLLKELADDFDGARRVYTDALTVVPAGDKRLFETALKRLKLRAPTDNKTSGLSPRQAEGLLAAVAVLLQGGPDAKGDDEPGFLFIDAATAANEKDFKTAIAKIDAARALHQKRALKLTGKGVNPNPQSDPTHQLFSDTCTYLKELYTLKALIYDDKVAGPIAKADGPAKALAKLTEAQDKADKADTARLKAVMGLMEAEMKLLKANKDLDAAKIALTTAQDEAKEAKVNEAAAAKKAEVAEKEVEKQKGLVTTAEKELKASQEKLTTAMGELTKAQTAATIAMKAATDAKEMLDKEKKSGEANAKFRDDILGVLKGKELVAADDTDKMVAAVKNLTANDAAKLVKELEAERKKTETALNKLKTAEMNLAAETVKLTTLMGEIDKKVQAAEKQAKADAEKAYAAMIENAKKAETAAKMKQMEAEMKFAEAEKKLLAAETEYNRKLALAMTKFTTDLTAQAEMLKKQFVADTADLRAQLAKCAAECAQIVPPEALAQEKALVAFTDGVRKYENGYYGDAEATFRAAVASDATDARYHYFLGLALFAQGNPAAEESFKTGGDLERRNRPNARDVGEALERVQGFARKELAKYRPQ